MKDHARLSTDLALPVPLVTLVDTLRRFGVTEAHVFGSYARGTFTPHSDLDLLVTFRAPTIARNFFDLQAALDELLPCDVDLTTRLDPAFEPYITPDLIRIL